MRRGSWSRRLARSLVAPLLLLAAEARAAELCPVRHGGATTSRVWPAPLDRAVSLAGRELSLREALDRLAAAARVRLSYASDLVPVDRAVCADFRAVPLGEALTHLLAGTPVEPLAAGADQVVLAPVRGGGKSEDATSPPLLVRRTSVLERVLVTGSATGASQRPLTVAVDVIEGRDLVRRNASSVAAALDGAVPGVWVWEQSPASLQTRYASIRGASSFGLSYPKVYIDGIEVANPLLLTHLAPDVVERVEVIRGPQGAALYGADAISGVVNIVTRHDGVSGGGTQLHVRSGAGMSSSDFASDVVAQDHALTLRTGSNVRSAGLALSMSTLGAYVPGGFSRQAMANGGVRLVGANRTLTATARLFDQRAGAPPSPVLEGEWEPRAPVPRAARRGLAREDPATRRFAPDSGTSQHSRQYTVGATASFMPNGTWTNAVVLGVDGYRLNDIAFLGGPIPSAADSALRAARGSADRATVRASAVGRFDLGSRREATLTLSAEHSALREATESAVRWAGGPTPPPPPGAVQRDESVLWRRTSGATAQAGVAIGDALFITGGLRLDRSSGYTLTSQVNALPMLGIAVMRDAGPATLKLRAAYGKGVRPPRLSLREAAWNLRGLANGLDLSAEEQSGVEVGGDLLVGRHLSLHATRFDQRATGLIQPVAVAEVADSLRNHRIAYRLQNVGEIANRGWELQGTVRHGAVSLGVAWSAVQSRVERLAPGYSGDLRPGDRMLEVPARTLSATLGWQSARWTSSWTVARASDWVNYDRLALAQDWSAGARPMSAYTGASLRGYWREYEGVTRVRATASRELVRGFSLQLTGDNLLGGQLGEPDNLTVVPGRTITLGIRTRF